MDLNEIHDKLSSAETREEHFKLYSDLFKLLNKKSKEDNGTFLSASPLVSRALVDLGVQDDELQQRILLILGLLISNKNSAELPTLLKQQALTDVTNLLVVTSNKPVRTRCFWCLSQFLDTGVVIEEPLVLKIFNTIESVQEPNLKTVALYGEACGLLQKMIEKNVDGLLKHVKILTKLVFAPVFHPVSKIREISYKNLQLVAPLLQDERDDIAGPVSSVIAELVKAALINNMLHCFRNKNEVYVLEVWKIVVNILGQSLHKNINIINGLLSVVEKGFKHESIDVKLKAFDAWKTLISNFALSNDIGIPKKLRLLLQPLLRISSSKTDAVVQAKCDTWWHIAWSLGDKIPNHFELVCLPLLEFVCGNSSKDNGEILVLSSAPVYSRNKSGKPQLKSGRTWCAVLFASGYQKITRQKGCEILIRFLEQPLSGTFVHSPKKTPTISIPPLRKSVSSVIFPKFPKEFVKTTEIVIKDLGNEPEMLPHIDYLLKLLLFAISNTSSDTSKDCIEAVTSFIHLVVDIVKCQLCPPVLCSKLTEKLSQLPKKMLTAHYYYVGNTSVMHGNLYLTILSLLLHPTFLTMPDFKMRVVPLFQKLAGSSIKSTRSPLSYAHSVILFMKEQAVINNCDAEILLSLWSAVSSALFGALQETLEISEGCNLEQDFSCMYDVLTYPFEHILMLNTMQGQFKTVLTKCWGDLYKLFYRCSALLPSTDNNTACEGVCLQLLKCLKKDHLENPGICEFLSLILPVIVECVDFAAPGKNSGKSGFSGERWAKSKQNPLGTIAPLTKVIKWLLEYFYENMSLDSSSNKDKEAHQSAVKFAVMHLEVLNVFISKVTSSNSLSAILSQLAEPLSKVYELSHRKNVSTKKNVHTFLTQLEILWKTITTNIQLYYSGQYDSDFLDVLSPLLEVTLRHHKQDIKDRTRQFWFASFAPNQSKLKYPPSLKEVFRKLRPPLVPGSDTSPIEEDTSFTNFSENEIVFTLSPMGKEQQHTPPVVKQAFDLISSVTQNKDKANRCKSLSPSVKTRSPCKSRPIKTSTVDLPDNTVSTPLPKDKERCTSPVKKQAFALIGSVAQNKNKANESKSLSPSVKTRTPSKSKPVKTSIDDLPDNEFVKIPIPPTTKKILTRHQKEARKRKSYVPALYNELSQNSCSLDYTADTQDSCSLMSVSPDECEVSVLAEFRDPLVVKVSAVKEKDNVSTSANDNSENKTSKKLSEDLHVIGPLESANSSKCLPDSTVNFHPEVMEVEVIDLLSQNESDSSNVKEDRTSQVADVAKDNVSVGSSEKVNHEIAELNLSVKSVNRAKESVTVTLPCHQSDHLQQTSDISSTSTGSRDETKDPSSDNKRSDSFTLHGEKQGKIAETSFSPVEVKQAEHLNTDADSEEIIPSSQSSPERDYDIPKSVGLVYRFNALSSVSRTVISNKSASKVISVGKPRVSGKLIRAVVINKGVSQDKCSSILVNSAGKAKKHSGTSEEPNVISDFKKNRNSTAKISAIEKKHAIILNSVKMNESQTVVHEKPTGVCENNTEKTKSNVDGTVPNEANISSCANEVSGNSIRVPEDKTAVVDSLSTDDVKGKLVAESQEVVNSPSNESFTKGNKHLKGSQNSEKPVSPKKAGNKNSSLESGLKGKSNETSPIVTFIENPSCVKTRRQTLQNCHLTRSKIKSLNASLLKIEEEESAKKKGAKKSRVRSPKKNARGPVTDNSFSYSQDSLSESSSSICMESERSESSGEPNVISDCKENRNSVSKSSDIECLSTEEVISKCEVKESVREMIDRVVEVVKLENFHNQVSEDLESNLEKESISDSPLDVENNEGKMHSKEVVSNNELQSINEEKVDSDDKIVNNVKETVTISTGSDAAPSTFPESIPTHCVKNLNSSPSQTTENQLNETRHSPDCTILCEKSSSPGASATSFQNDNNNCAATVRTILFIEKNSDSCNSSAKEGSNSDHLNPVLEIPHPSPVESETASKSCKHNDASCDNDIVIDESENLVSDKEILPESLENNEKFSMEEQCLTPGEKNNQVKVDCVIVDENAAAVNEAVLQSLDFRESQNNCVSNNVDVEDIEIIPVVQHYVVIPAVENEKVCLESDEEIQASKDTNGSIENTVSNSMHSKQRVECCDEVEVLTVNNCTDLPFVPSAEPEVVECLDIEVEADKSSTIQEQDTVNCESLFSDNDLTVQHQQISSAPSHNITSINLLSHKSDMVVKEPAIQLDSNLSLSPEEKSLKNTTIPSLCSKMNLTETKTDSCEKSIVDTVLQNDLNKEKIVDSMHKDITLQELVAGSGEDIRNDQTDRSTEASVLQSSAELQDANGWDNPAKEINNLICAEPVESISCVSDAELDYPGKSTLLNAGDCDTEPPLSPCRGARKRKQKTPSNSCVAMDVKRKKLELRKLKEGCEKVSSPKQTHNENVDLQCKDTPTKHSEKEDASLPAKADVLNQTNESGRPVPEKFMQLWHANVTLVSDANVAVQENKQKFPPEKPKGASPVRKGNNFHPASNQAEFQTDKTVQEIAKEGSSNSVLRDVRNSPLKLRSASYSALSLLMSPLSRSQRMVCAARKHMNSSPDTMKQSAHPKSPRTASLESPSTSKNSPDLSENSKVSTPLAYSSILKKRPSANFSSPPSAKRRKVSFAEPVVQGEMIFESCDSENLSRPRRSVKRCLQMNKDNSPRNQQKFFWFNQAKYPIIRRSKQPSNNEHAESSVENSATSENDCDKQKLEDSELKKSEEKTNETKLEGSAEGIISEQHNVILDKVDTSASPVAFSTSQLSSTSSPTASDIPFSDTYENSEEFDYDSQAIVFEDLINCNDPVDPIIPQLTSPMWVRGLSQLLLSRNIHTIGHLSSLTTEKLKALPIKSPKLETVKKILMEFSPHRLKPEVSKPSSANPSLPNSCDSSVVEADVTESSEIRQMDTCVSDQLAFPSEPEETSGDACEADSTDMQVEPCETSESTCKIDSPDALDEEQDKEKCREWIEKLCNSQVIKEMPLILLCDLLSKITSGIKAKNLHEPQEEDK